MLKTFTDKVDSVIDTLLVNGDKERVQDLLNKFSDVFDESLGHTTLLTHKIDTGNSAPIKQQPRRLPYVHREESKRQIEEMLDQGVIRHSTSAWSSPIILVKKKEWRASILRRLPEAKFSHCWPRTPFASHR